MTNRSEVQRHRALPNFRNRTMLSFSISDYMKVLLCVFDACWIPAVAATMRHEHKNEKIKILVNVDEFLYERVLPAINGMIEQTIFERSAVTVTPKRKPTVASTSGQQKIWSRQFIEICSANTIDDGRIWYRAWRLLVEPCFVHVCSPSALPRATVPTIGYVLKRGTFIRNALREASRIVRTAIRLLSYIENGASKKAGQSYFIASGIVHVAGTLIRT